MQNKDSSPLVLAGVVIAFALMIAAVWAADLSSATSLALTGGIVLLGVGIVAMIIPAGRARDQGDDQRDRMRQSTP